MKLLHGRPLSFWWKLAQESDFPLKAFALRTLRGGGDKAARLLLESNLQLPLWTRVWLLAGAASRQLLESFPEQHWARLALQLQEPPPPPSCLPTVRAILQNDPNPQMQLQALRALVQLGLEGLDELLRGVVTLLPSGQVWQERTRLLVLGLGLYGRDALLPIAQRWPTASRPARSALAQALWYLGPDAKGAERFLEPVGLGSTATLYALQGAGARSLIGAGRSPVWLDEQSLAALAEEAYGLDPVRQLYAVRAMQGWGPALPQVPRVVAPLLSSEPGKLDEAVWETLDNLAVALPAELVKRGLNSTCSTIRDAARRCLSRLPPGQGLESWQESAAPPSVDVTRALSEDSGLTVASPGRLPKARKTPSRRKSEALAVVPDDSQDTVPPYSCLPVELLTVDQLQQQARRFWLKPDAQFTAWLSTLLQHPHPELRLQAARCLKAQVALGHAWPLLSRAIRALPLEKVPEIQAILDEIRVMLGFPPPDKGPRRTE